MKLAFASLCLLLVAILTSAARAADSDNTSSNKRQTTGRAASSPGAVGRESELAPGSSQKPTPNEPFAPLTADALTTVPAAPQPAVEASVTPNRVNIASGQESAKLKYVFHNVSAQEFHVVERSAFFHGLETNWDSGIIGPMATDLKLPALADIEWNDDAYIGASMVESAAQAGALAQGELLFVQSFTLQGPDGAKTHVAAQVLFKIEKSAPLTQRLERNHFLVNISSSLESDPATAEKITRFLDFADASYEALAKVLGYTPKGGAKVPMQIVLPDGNPYYQAANGGYLNMPSDVVTGRTTGDWVWVAFPHELSHYFLLGEFPNPPKWFVEGPASFFGNKVSDALHYEKTTQSDRMKALRRAQSYTDLEKTFLFEPKWPEDGNSFGWGRSYQICQQLEQLCGADFFPKVFKYMRDNQFRFPRSANEKERMEILLGAMQSQTEYDLWAFFARAGFNP